MARGQAPLSVIEAGIGVLLLVGIAVSFVVAVPPPPGTAQLDAYANDALTILENEPPRHGGETRLGELTRSAASFERERDALHRRAARILPENVMYRLESPHGTLGHRLPRAVPTGTATATTADGTVTLRVWYV